MPDLDKSNFVNKNWLIGILVTICGFLIVMGITDFLNTQNDIKKTIRQNHETAIKNHEIVMAELTSIKEDIHGLDKKVGLGDMIDTQIITDLQKNTKRIEKLEDGR